MELKLAIEAKNLRVLNKAGAVAICTLWLPVDMVLKSLRDTSPDFLAPKSPLALIGGLYGGGLSIMLRNLHHNPQIDSLILMGKDFSGGAEHLKNFFAGKVKLTGRKQFFIFGDGRREELETIIIRGDGSDYIMDGLLKPNDFKAIPKIYDWSKVPLDKVKENVANFLSTYSPKVSIAERPLAIELPKPEINTYPSDIFGQTIIAKTIPEAWKELLSTIARFGKRVKFRNLKERLEILNLKVVIHEPSKLEPEEFKLLNLSESALEEYKNELINKEIYGGLPYTYGNRMRQYFNCDLLLEAIKDLSLANDSRHAYISLWDNLRDPHGSDTPCLVTVFFRKTEGKIHLSALFRSHNGARAWPINCVGLYGLMEFVCRSVNSNPEKTEEANLVPGTLTVTSMSISLNPDDLPQVEEIINNYDHRSYKMVTDPNGYLRITVDLEAKELVVFHHSHEGLELGRYRSKTPQDMSWQLERAKVISNLGHAMYVGSQLERAWYHLHRGREYIQDKSKLVD